jgi:hypothetical protein
MRILNLIAIFCSLLFAAHTADAKGGVVSGGEPIEQLAIKMFNENEIVKKHKENLALEGWSDTFVNNEGDQIAFPIKILTLKTSCVIGDSTESNCKEQYLVTQTLRRIQKGGAVLETQNLLTILTVDPVLPFELDLAKVELLK